MLFTLQNGKAKALVRSHGGELISFNRDNTEYVWQGSEEFWNGQAPILFPVCCSPKDGKMSHNGVDYPMSKHGFAMNGEFQPVYITKDAVTLELLETEETLKMFPFRFSLKATYTLYENGFSAEFSVMNLDKKEMTFCIGGHPGFMCPVSEADGSFEDYSLYFKNADGCTVSITKNGFMDSSVPKCNRLRGTDELPLKYHDFDNDAMIIENLPEKSVRLLSRRTGRGIRFDFDGFDALGLWTPDHKKAPFICLEPWNGLPADVDETTDAKSKKYAKTLAAGEEYSVGYKVTLIK